MLQHFQVNMCFISNRPPTNILSYMLNTKPLWFTRLCQWSESSLAYSCSFSPGLFKCDIKPTVSISTEKLSRSIPCSSYWVIWGIHWASASCRVSFNTCIHTIWKDFVKPSAAFVRIVNIQTWWVVFVRWYNTQWLKQLTWDILPDSLFDIKCKAKISI